LISVGGIILLRHDELVTHEGLSAASVPTSVKVVEAEAASD
jgi:hypothetical protein